MNPYSKIKVLNMVTGDRWGTAHGGFGRGGDDATYDSGFRERFYNIVEKGTYVPGTDNYGNSAFTDFEVSFPDALSVEETCDVYLTNFTVTAPRSSNSYYDINSNNRSKFGYSTANPTSGTPNPTFTEITLEEGIFTVPMTTAVSVGRPRYRDQTEGGAGVGDTTLNLHESVQLQGSVLDGEGFIYNNAGKLNQVHGSQGSGGTVDSLNTTLTLDMSVNSLTISEGDHITLVDALSDINQHYAVGDRINITGLANTDDTYNTFQIKSISDGGGGDVVIVVLPPRLTNQSETTSGFININKKTNRGTMSLLDNMSFSMRSQELFSIPKEITYQWDGSVTATLYLPAEADGDNNAGSGDITVVSTRLWSPVSTNSDGAGLVLRGGDRGAGEGAGLDPVITITEFESSAESVYGYKFKITNTGTTTAYQLGNVLKIADGTTSGPASTNKSTLIIKNPLDEADNIKFTIIGSDAVMFNNVPTGCEQETEYNYPWTNKFSFRGWTQTNGTGGVFFRTNGNTEYDKQIARYLGMKYYSTGGYWFIGNADTPAISTSSVTAPNDTLPDILPGSQYFLLNIEDSRGLLKTKSYSNIQSTNAEYSGIFRTKGHSIGGNGSILIPNEVPVGYNPGNHSFKSSKKIYIGEIGKTKIDQLNIKLTCAPGNKDPSIFIASGGSAFSERNNMSMQLLFVPKGMDIENSNLF